MADTTTSALNWASVENGKVKTTTSKKSDESNNGTMGYDQFLTLLCAEMQYQDPLEPTSNTEYVAQLATFSQLEAMLGMQDTQKNEMANNLVGKYVILKVSDETTGKTSYVDGKVDYVMYQEDGSQMLSVNNKLYSIDTLDTVADSAYYEAIGYAKTITNMLDQLPDIENITTKFSGAIGEIRKVYDGMTDYQKRFVSEDDLAKLKKYEQKIKLLTDKFMPPREDDEHLRAQRRKEMEQYADYRNYLSFSMFEQVTDEEGNVIRENFVDDMAGRDSGGEGQNPKYVALLAGFAMLYMQQNNRDSKIKLVLLDEAFSKMDQERSAVCLKYARKMDLQLIVCVPDERLQSLIRNVDCAYGFRRYQNQISMMHIDKGDYLKLMEGEEE